MNYLKRMVLSSLYRLNHTELGYGIIYIQTSVYSNINMSVWDIEEKNCSDVFDSSWRKKFLVKNNFDINLRLFRSPMTYPTFLRLVEHNKKELNVVIKENDDINKTTITFCSDKEINTVWMRFLKRRV